MSEITLVRGDRPRPTEKERAQLQLLLYEFADGLGEKDRRAWRRLWNRIIKSEPGEIFVIRRRQPRVGKFHRFTMALQQRLMESQEVFTDFDALRYWLKIGAGFVEWHTNERGEIFPIPRSVAFDKCSEDDAREFFIAMVGFLRTEHAAKYLWPHLSARKAAEMMESVLAEFDA
jgi:hypothetical protein